MCVYAMRYNVKDLRIIRRKILPCVKSSTQTFHVRFYETAIACAISQKQCKFLSE